MSTQAVTAQMLLSTGEIVDLASTLTDTTAGELKTSGVVGSGGGIAATSIGTYANGKSCVAMIQPVTATGFIVYAYISRRGQIQRNLMIGSTEIASQPMAIPFTFQAGDTISVLVQVSTALKRTATLNVITSSGTNAIFTVAPTGLASNNLTHILSGQGIGQSLTGQKIASHWATSIESSLYAGGSVLYVNDRGLPAGSCIVTNPNDLQVMPNAMANPTVNLNWQAQVVTSA